MVKTIDINAKQWKDKSNGNSYFCSTITVNFGLKNEETFFIPFQYGYDSQYIYESLNLLKKMGYINTLSEYNLSQNGIILRTNIKTNCKKSELIEVTQ
jgi:hypothetical protein